MARSVSEIKKTMTDAFMADEVIREKYNLKAEDRFGDCFSTVSLENLLFFILASSYYVLECIFDAFRKDVEEKISRAVVASVPWYHKMALRFQYGDRLVFNETTYGYEYAKEDESKQVVKYVAVRDRGTSLQILVSADNGGKPVPLSASVLSSFKQYMNRVKIVGTILSVKSLAADNIQIHATVKLDALLYNSDGSLIEDGTYPVREAIDKYLGGILYGGTFNKTKLVDAIQSVDGVIDVELGTCKVADTGGSVYTTISGNNYNSVGGSFLSQGLENSLNYDLQN